MREKLICINQSNLSPAVLEDKFSHLDRGGEEPRDSSSFFWPIEGFFGGVFALFPCPAGNVADGIREFN